MVPEPKLLTFSEIRARQRNHVVRQAEIPVEYSVSLPLPTRRAGLPSYAFFAAAAQRRPEQPTIEDVPDRWCLLDAAGGRLLLYALCQVVPFAPGASFAPVTLPLVTRSIEAIRTALRELEAALDGVVGDFFAGRPGAPVARMDALTRLEDYLPAPLLPTYRALVPDFFTWLEAS